MNTYSRQIWDMIKRCIIYGRKHERVWITIPVINTQFEKLEGSEQRIATSVQNQTDSDPSGHIQSKNDAIAELTKRMYRLGRSMASIAKIHKNAVMRQVSDVSETDLNQLLESKKFTKFMQMINTARQNLELLVEVGVTNDTLNTLEADVATTEKMPMDVASHTSDMKASTQQITENIADARTQLEILDDLFEAMIANETFLNSWFEERHIKGRHHPKKPTDTPTS